MKKLIVFFLLLSAFTYGDNLSDMKKKVTEIDKGIKDSNSKITRITRDKKVIKKDIEAVERELKIIESKKAAFERGKLAIEKEKTVIEREKAVIEKQEAEIIQKISALSRKIEFNKRTLAESSKELVSKNQRYRDKLQAWNKVTRHSNDETYSSHKMRNFRDFLYSDLNELERIRMFQKDVDLEKIDTEKIRNQERILKNQQTAIKNRLISKAKEEEKKKQEIDKKKREIEKKQQEANKKKKQKDTLIEELNQQEKYHKTKINSLQEEKKRIESQIQKIIVEKAKQDKKVDITTAKLILGKMEKPVKGTYAVRFGQMKSGDVKSNGVEISAQVGSRISASANGKIIYAGKFQGLGKVVMVDYGKNMIGIYGNLLSIYVNVGQSVTKGQSVGVLGLSTDGKPHLYYELRFNLKAIDPVKMF